MNSAVNRHPLRAAVLAGVLLVSAAAQAQVRTLDTSRNPQDRIEARWEQTHQMNNQRDSRSYDQKYPGATPGVKLDCDVSHDTNSNVNTIRGCRYVAR